MVVDRSGEEKRDGDRERGVNWGLVVVYNERQAGGNDDSVPHEGAPARTVAKRIEWPAANGARSARSIYGAGSQW